MRRGAVGWRARLVGAVAVSAGIYTRTHPNTAAAESGVAAVPNLGVIAILPFVSLGADTTNTYLATGVTNAVAGKLMKTAGLRVLAPGRPRSVKRRSDTAATAWVEARLVLEGTVERVGNRLRVTARLSSTDDDVMRWRCVRPRRQGHLCVEDEIADASWRRFAYNWPGKSSPSDRWGQLLELQLGTRSVFLSCSCARCRKQFPAPTHLRRPIRGLKQTRSSR